MRETRTFTARWVFPVASSPLPNGTVSVHGNTIAAVEAKGVRTPDEDLGNVAIIPGLVNAHTHLDLSGARGLIPPTDPEHFTDWLRGVIAYRRSRTPEQVQADIRDGLAECLRFGTTFVGDITVEGASYPAIAAAKTRAVVFHEMVGLGEERAKAAFETMRVWVREHRATASCRPGTNPHAPYSAAAHLFSSAALLPVPLATHLAESTSEIELLEQRSGAFVAFLTELGVWKPENLASSIPEVLTRFADSARQKRSWGRQIKDPCLLVHCNYLSPDTQLQPQHSIVYCPRTHGAFQHPPHPFREFLKRGVRVCLGTDSLASNPDLDILAEARFVHAQHPDFPSDQLLRMVTISGAEALGWANETGSLEPGKSADFVAVPLPNVEAADPHELLFADHPGERRTLFRGQWRT